MTTAPHPRGDARHARHELPRAAARREEDRRRPAAGRGAAAALGLSRARRTTCSRGRSTPTTTSRAPSGAPTAATPTTSERGRTRHLAPNAVLDLRGVVCPGPIVEAKKLLNGMRAGETLKLVSNCPGIADDVADWVKATGYKLLETEEIGPGEFEFYIGKCPDGPRLERAHARSRATGSSRRQAEERDRDRGRCGVHRLADRAEFAEEHARRALRAAAGAALFRVPRRVPGLPHARRRPDRARAAATTRGASSSPPRWPTVSANSSPTTSPISWASDTAAGRQAPVHRAGQRAVDRLRRASTGPTTAPTTGSCAASVIASPTSMSGHDRTWAMSQVIEVEAPEAAARLLPRAWPACSTSRRAGATRGARATGE